jgi:hypothetical protein
MSEITKSEQARINGKRSRGPVTADGKARSANNATKHGRYAKSAPEPNHPILLKCENGAAYQDLLHRLLQDLLPTNSFELALVREVCAIEWLITRNFSVQTRLLDVQVAAECDAIRRGQGSLRGIEPIDAISLATEKLLTSSTTLAQSRREFTRLQRARRDAMNMLFSLRKHQQSVIRSQELPDTKELDRQTAEGAIHRNEPTDWPLEDQECQPEIPPAATSAGPVPDAPATVALSAQPTTTEPEPEQEPELEQEEEEERGQAPSAQPSPEANPASQESSAAPLLEPVPERQRRATSTTPAALPISPTESSDHDATSTPQERRPAA